MYQIIFEVKVLEKLFYNNLANHTQVQFMPLQSRIGTHDKKIVAFPGLSKVIIDLFSTFGVITGDSLILSIIGNVSFTGSETKLPSVTVKPLD